MLINLHSHLEGRVRASTAAELGLLAGLVEPAGGWERALRLAGPGNLTVYLAVVSSTYPFFGRPEWIRRIVVEAVEDAAAEGIDYLELRFGPVTHVRDGITLDDVLAAACAGLAEGEQANGMPAGLVIAALRKHDEATNRELARAAARFAGAGVVGFDLAGDEKRFPDLRPHAAAFGLARAAGLGLTAHAAEAATGTAARQAVELFGVSRIGRGLRRGGRGLPDVQLVHRRHRRPARSSCSGVPGRRRTPGAGRRQPAADRLGTAGRAPGAQRRPGLHRCRPGRPRPDQPGRRLPHRGTACRSLRRTLLITPARPGS
jgi:adenosine deaminase